MTESELRAHVAKQLRRDDVPDWLWQFLVKRRYIHEVLVMGEADDLLIEEAKLLLRGAREGEGRTTPPSRKSADIMPPRLQAHEHARAQAFSEFLGNHIATIPRVRHRRADLFGGHILSPAQAEAFLHSPALRFL